MALTSTFRKLSSSLNFRILAPLFPVVIIMLLLGGAIFSLGLGTVSHHPNARISEDLERSARDVYSICDAALQSLVLDGHADVEGLSRVRKGNTLGKIEEYARQHNLEILVLENGNLL